MEWIRAASLLGALLSVVGCGRINFQRNPLDPIDGSVDAGFDGGAPDAGMDAGNRLDAGAPDAGVDAGPPDAGGPCIREVVAAEFQSCVLYFNGEIDCWGANGGGQLGLGRTSTREVSPRPQPMRLDGVVDIDLSDFGGCARTEAGQLFCWGVNGDGQVGDGTTNPALDPVSITVPEPVTAISGGGYHVCALGETGTVYCWGRNSEGQAGQAGTADVLSAMPVSGVPRAVAIAAGGFHTCAIDASGAVWCWGRNVEGQIGNGVTGGSVSAPFLVSAAGSAARLALGDWHTCVARDGGEVWCWGKDAEGQLGDGAAGAERPVPALAMSFGGASQLRVGDDHSCVMDAGGEVWCWGINTEGEADPSQPGVDSPTPVVVAGGGSWVGVAAGRRHTCVLGVEDLVKCWGRNLAGELGDGTTTSRPTSDVVPLRCP